MKRPDPLLCFMAGMVFSIASLSLQLDVWGLQESVRRMVNGWAPAWRTVPEALVGIAFSLWVYRREVRRAF